MNWNARATRKERKKKKKILHWLSTSKQEQQPDNLKIINGNFHWTCDIVYTYDKRIKLDKNSNENIECLLQ